MPPEAYRAWCIMKSGFVEIYHTPKGTMVLPKSISFAKMTEETFQEVYSKVLDVIISDIGVNKEIIEQQLLSFL